MSTNHYIVALIDHSWQFSIKGDVTAPFASRDEAVNAAIAEAKQSGEVDAAVIVRDANLQNETVWQPTT